MAQGPESGASAVPPELRRFIAAHFRSVLELEVLLLVAGAPARTWTADDVAAELRIDAAWAGGELATLAKEGLIAEGPAGVHRFSAREADTRLVEALARAYRERRVAIIELIYARPEDPLRQFSDAFLFKKPKGHDDD